MQRIVVLGRGGSGKTVLANRLGAVLGLPVTHLDALSFDPDWNRVPAGEFAARHREVTAGERWVVDGNHLETLPARLAAADTVVLLNLPAAHCLRGILRRRLRYRGGQHPDGVYDRARPRFLVHVLRYRRTVLPRVRAAIADHASRLEVVELRSRSEVDHWVRRLEGGTRSPR